MYWIFIGTGVYISLGVKLVNGAGGGGGKILKIQPTKFMNAPNKDFSLFERKMTMTKDGLKYYYLRSSTSRIESVFRTFSSI